MAILTGPEIEYRIATGDIVIDPYDPAQVGPNSYDLHLADTLLVYGRHELDMAREESTEVIVIGPGGYVLLPGTLYLGSTVEFTATHGLAPVIETRSSVARLGLQAHLSAGFGDDGFAAPWTLELAVIQPLRIYAGVALCQIAFSTLEGNRRPYVGKYQGQHGPQPSRLWRELQGPLK